MDTLGKGESQKESKLFPMLKPWVAAIGMCDVKDRITSGEMYVYGVVCKRKK